LTALCAIASVGERDSPDPSLIADIVGLPLAGGAGEPRNDTLANSKCDRDHNRGNTKIGWRKMRSWLGAD